MVLDRKQVSAFIIIVTIIGASIFVYFYVLSPNGGEHPVFKGGTINQDETWSGSIFVNDSTVVPSGVTLTIDPGTRIMFAPCRDYKDQRTAGFAVV